MIKHKLEENRVAEDQKDFTHGITVVQNNQFFTFVIGAV